MGEGAPPMAAYAILNYKGYETLGLPQVAIVTRQALGEHSLFENGFPEHDRDQLDDTQYQPGIQAELAVPASRPATPSCRQLPP